MKFKIYCERDFFIIEADSLIELKEKIIKEIDKLNWSIDNCRCCWYEK